MSDIEERYKKKIVELQKSIIDMWDVMENYGFEWRKSTSFKEALDQMVDRSYAKGFEDAERGTSEHIHKTGGLPDGD